MPDRRVIIRALFLLLLPLCLSLRPGSAISQASREPGAGPGQWNLLLITVDTLRPDHLSCYGHEGIRTPTIDALAREGVLFSDAVTSIPITLPSHASILTGLYPPTHGIRFNGAYALDDSISTLAEVLGNQGYTSGAIVGSYALDSEFGLDQGFMTYNDSYPMGNILKYKYPELWPTLSRLLLAQVLAKLLPLDILFSEPQRRAEEVTDAALEWLGRHGRQRFFLWLHYFDPHTPYDPPPDPDQGPPRTSIPDRSLVTVAPPYRYWWGELGRIEDVYSRYDGEIEYTDRWLEQVIAQIDRLGVKERTLIVFTADHGECLWEHGQSGHGYSVYDAELKVPLIMSLPGMLPGGVRINSPVELIDLFPTILDLLQIPVPGSIQGKSLLDLIRGKGIDHQVAGNRAKIPPAIGGEAHEVHRLAYSETLWPPAPGDRLKGLRTPEWKFIMSLAGENRLLYHLPSDPHELRDVSGENPELVKAFEGGLSEISRRIGDEGGLLPEMEEEVEARLKALGYVR